VYEGGNLQDLERALGVSGDRILYVGDHIYGDILRSKKESAWRTAMIVQEMQSEIAAHDSSASDLQALSESFAQRDQLEDERRAAQAQFKDLARQAEAVAEGAACTEIEANRSRAKRRVERVRGLMRTLDAECNVIEARLDRRFHPYWGSLMKESNEMSSFGEQVESYACLYTSRVSNLLHYSPLQHFRSPRDLMPHEM
jgi:5'-nucleotidase